MCVCERVCLCWGAVGMGVDPEREEKGCQWGPQQRLCPATLDICARLPLALHAATLPFPAIVPLRVLSLFAVRFIRGLHLMSCFKDQLQQDECYRRHCIDNMVPSHTQREEPLAHFICGAGFCRWHFTKSSGCSARW